MLSNYISQCHECDAIISLSTISDLQNKVDRRYAKLVNRKHAIEKNNLGGEFNQESAQKLMWWNDILSEIGYCNACFEDYEIDKIFDLVKTELANG